MNDEYGNAKKAPDDDWAMNTPSFETTKLPPIANEIPLPAQTDFNDEDEIITLIRSGATDGKEKKDEWKMPEPVFRVSSGRTPDKVEKPPAQTGLPFAKAISLEKNTSAGAVAPVQPQPNISEEFTVRETVNKPPSADKQKSFNIIFVILGIAAIVFFAVAFLAAVYFLFFYKTEV